MSHYTRGPVLLVTGLAILLLSLIAWPITLWRWRHAPKPMSRRQTLAEEYDTEHFGGEPIGRAS